MYLNNKYKITKTYKSFVRYVQYFRKSFKYDIYQYEKHKTYLTQSEIDDYVELRILMDLDEIFISLLDVGEKIAFEILEKRTTDLTLLCKKLIHDIYEKWIKIFFSDDDKYYKKISSKKLGLKMKLIREKYNISKVELANRLKVNRKTVGLLENGERLPSLEYIYNFSLIFDMKIEDLIK